MENLRKLRLEKGLSQQAVADHLGLTRQAYSNYEKGSRAPDQKTLIRLADFFSVSVDTLLRGGDLSAEPYRASDDDIKFALFGADGKVTDAMYEEVKRFARMVKLREEAERKNSENQ